MDDASNPLRHGRFRVSRLERRMEIGCAPEEHGVQQAVEITLDAVLAHEHLFAGDTRTPPYDYAALVEAVDAAIASRPRFVLQETLAVAIAARALADARVERLVLEIAKTERYTGCRSIGVVASFDRAALARLAPRYPEDAALQRLAAR